MIDQDTIRRIFDATDIVDVIGDYIKLKRSGTSFKGLSPFTNEKTPSFFVSPAKGIFKDFSSGKGGNAVTFLMEHEKMSYPEALRYLAKKYHIELVEKEVTAEEIQQLNERESLLIITSFAQKYFYDILKNNPEGQAVGKSYFAERGIRDDMIEKFQLGYSLEKRDGFTQEALKNGYKLDYLVKTGLTIQKEDYQFDRFSGRVIFPIHSISGKVVGFGGRILKSDKTIAKYLNSPESEIYHKSRELFGLYFAKAEIIRKEKCYLVEGYTDVIGMHQAGIENVVASSGTALTIDQIKLIKRFTENITIIYDGDEAGIKASLRGIDLILEQGLNVKVVLLPEGEDPDSYSHKLGASEFLKYLVANETDFIKFKTQLLAAESLNDPIKKARLINEVVKSISIIPDSITRTVYVRECSRILEIQEPILFTEIGKLRRQLRNERFVKEERQAGYQYEREYLSPFETEKRSTAQLPEAIVADNFSEKSIIELLLKYGNNEFQVIRHKDDLDEHISVAQFIIKEIEHDELIFNHPVYYKIYEEVKAMVASKKPVDEAYFIQHLDNEICTTSVNLVTTEPGYELSKIYKKKDCYIQTPELTLDRSVPEILINFKSRRLDRFIKDNLQQIKLLQDAGNNDKVIELMNSSIIYNDVRKKIAKELNGRVVM